MTEPYEPADTRYSRDEDWTRRLNNYLGHTKQQGGFDWVMTCTGTAAYPTHSASATLNNAVIGQGQGNTKGMAKKHASFEALKSLGQV